MSRTRRRDPGGCWMRCPRHKRARIAASVLADPELAEIVNRQPKRMSQPPDAWDDLIVSYWRGQAWARKARSAPLDPARLRYAPVLLDWAVLRARAQG